MVGKAVRVYLTDSKRQSWAARISSMSKQNGCLPLRMSPDSFRLTKASTQAHAHAQTFSHNRCASMALCLPFADQDSTKAMHKHTAVNYHFSTGSNRRASRSMENSRKSQSKVEEIKTISSQGLKLGDECYTDKRFTIISLGDVLCPTGCKMRTLHILTHNLSHYLSLFLSSHAHTHLHTCSHTDAQCSHMDCI